MDILSKGIRTDLEDLFKLSGLFEGKNLHSNLITIQEIDGAVIIGKPKEGDEIRFLDSDTTVIARWPGKFRSDVFIFKVSDYIDFLNKK